MVKPPAPLKIKAGPVEVAPPAKMVVVAEDPPVPQATVESVPEALVRKHRPADAREGIITELELIVGLIRGLGAPYIQGEMGLVVCAEATLASARTIIGSNFNSFFIGLLVVFCTFFLP